MKDHGVALSRLGNQAMLVNLTPEQEQRVLELIAEIQTIFDQSLDETVRFLCLERTKFTQGVPNGNKFVIEYRISDGCPTIVHHICV